MTREEMTAHIKSELLRQLGKSLPEDKIAKLLETLDTALDTALTKLPILLNADPVVEVNSSSPVMVSLRFRFGERPPSRMLN